MRAERGQKAPREGEILDRLRNPVQRAEDLGASGNVDVAFRIDIAEVAGDENAVEQASKSLGDLRIAEIVELDMQLDANGKVEAYRSKVKLSFKYEDS
jgi:flavin-binding protein dodecin